MPVQNFLEDEDYDQSQQVDQQMDRPEGGVPNFLQDEEYEDITGDEYYGGGFTDGGGSSYSVGGGSFEGGEQESFGGYEDDEHELFDGSDPFDGEEDGGEGEASYGISGLPSISAPRAIPTDSVPNFLSDEDEFEDAPRSSTGTTTPTPPSSTASSSTERSKTTPVAAVESGTTDGSTSTATKSSSTPTGGSSTTSPTGSTPSVEGSVSSPNGESTSSGREKSAPSVSSGESGEQQLRQRRDLSRRPASAPSSAPERTPSNSTPPTQDTSGGRRVAEASPSPSATTPTSAPQGDASKFREDVTTEDGATPTATVRFDPRAAVSSVSEEEAADLKSPSAYAAGRDLKFTALKQNDSTVRRVGEDGLTPAERSRAAKVSATPTRTPTNGKLSQEELLFYANLGAQRSADFGGKAKRDLFLPPVLEESAAQKKERESRINRALANGSLTYGARSRLTERDYRVLQFIAIFKFASERQIAKLLQCAEITAYKRLNDLRKHGLTKGFKTLGVKGSVWVLTETGMDLSGFDLPRGTEAGLTLSMVSHQFTVNHVAAHLWSGGANVLGEKSFPRRNRPDGKGGFDFGERIISELQIQSAFGRVRGTSKADAFVPQIKRQMANQFDNWKRAGGAEFGPSPELQQGNEHMWTLFPPISNRLNYHVPDLVVARPRSSDGKAQSIAVEIELRTKADDSSYERTLDAYRVDDSIYRKVVWVCRLKGTAEKLSRIAKRNGLADQGRIEIVPIYLDGGRRFTGNDTWSL